MFLLQFIIRLFKQLFNLLLTMSDNKQINETNLSFDNQKLLSII